MVANNLSAAMDERDPRKKFRKILFAVFSQQWNIIIAVSVYLTFLVCVYELVFIDVNRTCQLVVYTSDTFYFVDVVCNFVYRNVASIKKFSAVQPRSGIFLFLDVISLIPFEISYVIYIQNIDEHSEATRGILTLNRCLRIYRIFQLFASYDNSITVARHYALHYFFYYLSFFFMLTHIITCVRFSVSASSHEACADHAFYCWLHLETSTFFLIILNWGGPSYEISTPPERLLAFVAVFLGFVAIQGSAIPKAMHIFMKIYRDKAKYYHKYLRLERFVNNMIADKYMQDRIYRYYNHIWTVATLEPQVLNNLPLNMQKDIYCDIYWDAFRHSGLFRHVSRNFKRSLSLVMQTMHLQEGDIVYHKDKKKLRMVYLAQGILHLMAEENDESPVISFSSGTVLGESSLYLQLKNSAIVKCGSFCVLHVVNMSALMRVIRKYPHDKRIILNSWRTRLVMARITQWRKYRLCVEQSGVGENVTGVFTRSSKDSIKWLKYQWRGIYEAHERFNLVHKLREEGVRVPPWRKEFYISTSIESISNYLDMLVVSDSVEVKKDVVCLRTALPWAIDPESNFLRHWKMFVKYVAVIPAILYPYYTGWEENLPLWIFNFSLFITLIFAIDVVIQLSTAVKTKHALYTKFSKILLYCLRRPTFYLDFLAALPMQVYIVFRENKSSYKSLVVGPSLMLALLKIHMLLKLTGPKVNISTACCAVYNIFLCTLFIYWFGTLLQLTGIRCLTPCSSDDWPFQMDFGEELSNWKAIIMAVITSLGVPIPNIFPTQYPSFLILLFIKIFFFFLFCMFIADMYAIYTAKISNEINFNTILKLIRNYLSDIQVPSRVKNRVIKTIDFQWAYDKGDYIMSTKTIIDSASDVMKKEIFEYTLFDTLKSCHFFKEESDDFIRDAMLEGTIVSVPAGTTMITFGTRSIVSNILHKGFCQMSSSLKKDIKHSLSPSTLYGRGTIFPILANYCNVPAPISVSTLTDCEFFTIAFEKLLDLSIKHGIFKDVIEVLGIQNYEAELQEITPALIQTNVRFNPPIDEKEVYMKPFSKFRCFGIFFRKFLRRKAFSMEADVLQNWGFTYNLLLTLTTFLWPMVFGALMFYSNGMVLFLLFLKIFHLVNMYIQLHIPYYNDNGLLISHPLYTAQNYLKYHFISDAISIFPFYEIYKYGIKDPMKEDHTIVVTIIILLKGVDFIHIIRFLTALESITSFKGFFRVSRRIFIAAALINAFVNWIMNLGANWVYDSPHSCSHFELPEEEWAFKTNIVQVHNSTVQYFAAISFFIITGFTTNPNYWGKVVWHEFLTSLLNDVSGQFISVTIFVWFSSRSFVQNMNVTIYQDRMKSFCEYLKSQNTDDKIVDAAVYHFEHEWSRSRGEDLVEILRRLPRLFFEDLMYPIYRSSFTKIGFLADANAGFHRLLSATVVLEYIPRGAVVVDQDEVNSYIYFIHQGKCFVLDWFITLEKGSMLGDIRRQKKMENRIYALTHVELLKIPSDRFYLILNDYYETEQAYFQFIKDQENFIQSGYIHTDKEIRVVDSRDALQAFGLKVVERKFEDESYFDDPSNAVLYEKFSFGEKKRIRMIIYPNSLALTIYQVMSLATSFITMIALPIFIPFGTLTKLAYIVIGTLDFLWFLKILASFRMGVEDKIKGDLITNAKYMAKHYAKKFDGLVVDLLSCLPIEFLVIYSAKDRKSINVTHVNYLRSFRLLRVIFLLKFLRTQTQKLKVRYATRWTNIFVNQILLFNLFTLYYIATSTAPEVVSAINPWHFGAKQLSGIIFAYQTSLNYLSSANMITHLPTTGAEAFCLTVLAFASTVCKGVIVSRVLSLVFVINLTRAKYKFQVVRLEKFLYANEVSKAIVDEVLDYKLKLLISCRSENMPYFLLSAPPILRTSIMKDLYFHRLKSCPLFEDLKSTFMTQLVGRLQRQIFFCGQKITEKGDVDNNMYFIHKGEISEMETSSTASYIDYEVDILRAGDSFGLLQGLYMSLPHKYTYRAITYSEILILNIDKWNDLRNAFPEIVDEIKRKAKLMNQ